MKIGHEMPVNGTAARVMSAGFGYKSKKVFGCICSPLPVPMRAATTLELNNQTWANLAGKKFGRFTVVGISEERLGMWVVRCVCGNYSERKAKSIRNPSNSADCCEECRSLLYIKREDIRRRTGRNVDVRGLI